MRFDPEIILAQKSTTMLTLIEELACEYSRRSTLVKRPFESCKAMLLQIFTLATDPQ